MIFILLDIIKMNEFASRNYFMIRGKLSAYLVLLWFCSNYKLFLCFQIIQLWNTWVISLIFLVNTLLGELSITYYANVLLRTITLLMQPNRFFVCLHKPQIFISFVSSGYFPSTFCWGFGLSLLKDNIFISSDH